EQSPGDCREIATSLSREDQDAVRGQHQRGAMTQTMQRLRLGINATAVAHDVGVDPILVDVAVKDFTPLTAAGKTDPIVEPIERRKMRDDEHPVSFAFDPALEREHAILVVDVHNAKSLAAQARIAPAQIDELARETQMIEHLLVGVVESRPVQ